MKIQLARTFQKYEVTYLIFCFQTSNVIRSVH